VPTPWWICGCWTTTTGGCRRRTCGRWSNRCPDWPHRRSRRPTREPTDAGTLPGSRGSRLQAVARFNRGASAGAARPNSPSAASRVEAAGGATPAPSRLPFNAFFQLRQGIAAGLFA
jgi:hypothetical protein